MSVAPGAAKVRLAAIPKHWLAIFFVCALLLPPLPFPFGDAGIHVAPLAALAGVVAGVIRLRGWRARNIRSERTLASSLLLFFLVLLVSVAFAAVWSGWHVAIGSLTRVLLLGISVYIFFYTWIGPRDDSSGSFPFARLLFQLALASAAFACLDFYFRFPAPARFEAQYLRLGRVVVKRAQGVFYDASTLGNLCAFFLVMILVAALSDSQRGPQQQERRALSRSMLIAGALVFTAALILSASRASVITVIVAAIALSCIQRKAARRIVIVSGVSLAAAAGAIRLAVPDYSTRYWLRNLASFRYFGSSPDGVLSGRLTHWSVLADFVRRHPWHIIFGIGYKTLPYTNYLGRPIVADNTYLSLLVETGVIGLAVFLLLNVAILRAAWRSARSGSARGSFFGLWMFCFWCGELVQMLSGDLITYWRVLPVYFWVLAAALRESGRSIPAGTD